MLNRPVDVGAADQRRQVAAEQLRLGEAVECPAVAELLGRVGRGVRKDRPSGRRGDAELVARLDVRLIEAREQPVRLIGLEVGVDVLGAVLGIHKAMEAITGRVVVIDVSDADRHRGADSFGRQGQPIARPVRLEALAVDLQALDLAPAEIQEQRTVATRVEVDRDVAAVGRLARHQVERDLIAGVADARGALLCLCFGQHIARGDGAGQDRALRQGLGLLKTSAAPLGPDAGRF